MIKISYWARDHKTAARIILAVLYVLLFTGTVYVAVLLDQINVHLPYTATLTAVVLLVASVLIYSSGKQAKKSVSNYFKRKGCEIVFLWATLICTCFVYNKDSRVMAFNTYEALNGSFVTSKEKVKETPAHSDKFSKKSVKKQFKELLKELRKNKTSSGGKIALISLLILGGIGLSILLAGLSCNISCNGNHALATAVFFGGLTVIIFLIVLAIKKINQSERVKKESGIPTSQ